MARGLLNVRGHGPMLLFSCGGRFAENFVTNSPTRQVPSLYSLVGGRSRPQGQAAVPAQPGQVGRHPIGRAQLFQRRPRARVEVLLGERMTRMERDAMVLGKCGRRAP